MCDVKTYDYCEAENQNHIDYLHAFFVFAKIVFFELLYPALEIRWHCEKIISFRIDSLTGLDELSFRLCRSLLKHEKMFELILKHGEHVRLTKPKHKIAICCSVARYEPL